MHRATYWRRDLLRLAGRGARLLRAPRSRQFQDLLAGPQGAVRRRRTGPDGAAARRAGAGVRTREDLPSQPRRPVQRRQVPVQDAHRRPSGERRLRPALRRRPGLRQRDVPARPRPAGPLPRRRRRGRQRRRTGAGDRRGGAGRPPGARPELSQDRSARLPQGPPEDRVCCATRAWSPGRSGRPRSGSAPAAPGPGSPPSCAPPSRSGTGWTTTSARPSCRPGENAKSPGPPDRGSSTSDGAYFTNGSIAHTTNRSDR